MTGVVLIKAAATLGVIGAEGVMLHLAVMDPSVANIALTAIGAVVAITTVVFAFKTAKLNALTKKVEEYAVRQVEQEKQLKAQDVKVAEVIKTTDGMKDALVASTAEASKAKGILEEKAAETVRSAERIIAASISSTVQQVTKEPVILKQIEKHTEDTANNTARTEATVQEIKEKQ